MGSNSYNKTFGIQTLGIQTLGIQTIPYDNFNYCSNE